MGDHGAKCLSISSGKIRKTPEENVIIRAILFKLPPFKTNEEFVRLIKEAEAKNINSERLKLIKHELVAVPNKGTDCTKSHMAAEDHAAAQKAGKTGVMVQEGLMLTCAHPKDKGVGITVGYSHRYYPNQRDPRFLEKATSVLDSVEFADL